MSASGFDLEAYLERRRIEVDGALDGAVPPEEAPPALIHRAMRYALFAGGKRLRPILVLAGHAVAVAERAATPAADQTARTSSARGAAVQAGRGAAGVERGDASAADEAFRASSTRGAAARAGRGAARAEGEAASGAERASSPGRALSPESAAGHASGAAGSPAERASSPARALSPQDASDQASSAAALDFACAVECIHTYSLVHDDLPALDDDDLRRGRPTVHKAFDEATAILVGDALLTVAIEIALGPPAAGPALMRERRAAALRVLVSAIGTSGMIGGQLDDLGATGGSVDEARVRSIHERKTGALLRACPVIGGLMAGANEGLLARLGSYGADLGLAFQIVDDILDIEGTSQGLGKTAGKDAAAGKATFPAAIGLARSRTLAEELARRAEQEAVSLGEAARPLAALAGYVVRRRR